MYLKMSPSHHQIIYILYINPKPGTPHDGRLTGPALFRAWEILGYGFQNMVFRTWDLNFGAWEILGYGFQNMVFRTWDLNFGAWEILGYGFQDMVFRT
jgi:hypothetical protein